jgi:hypothetical protein
VSCQQRARAGRDGLVKRRAVLVVQQRATAQAPVLQAPEGEGITTGVTNPSPAWARAGASLSGLLRWAAWELASTRTTWGDRKRARAEWAAAAGVAWTNCHWAQRLPACEASACCYCARCTWRRTEVHHCGAAAAWAVDSACHCTTVDLTTRTGASQAGGSDLHGPLYGSWGGDGGRSAVEECATN